MNANEDLKKNNPYLCVGPPKLMVKKNTQSEHNDNPYNPIDESMTSEAKQ